MIPLEYRHVTKSERRGRAPQGERALTGAERQARYRQRQAASRPVPPRPTRALSRVGRPPRISHAPELVDATRDLLRA